MFLIYGHFKKYVTHYYDQIRIQNSRTERMHVEVISKNKIIHFFSIDMDAKSIAYSLESRALFM